MSWQNEFGDQSYNQSVIASLRDDRPPSTLGESLASELDNLNDSDEEWPKKDFLLQSLIPPHRDCSNHRDGFQARDYSGSEWGDPAEDSDPDGRYACLNETIYQVALGFSPHDDSGYISNEEQSGESANERNVRDERAISSDDTSAQFIHDLKNMVDQIPLESKTKSLVQTHNLAIGTLVAKTLELRDMLQPVYLSHFDGNLDQKHSQELVSAIQELQSILPSQVSQVTGELALLQAETNALVADLNLMKDTLQEMRPILASAQRMLRAVKDGCEQWTLDNAIAERARHWLELHDSGNKVLGKTASKELLSICHGFDKFCVELRRQIETTEMPES